MPKFGWLTLNQFDNLVNPKISNTTSYLYHFTTYPTFPQSFVLYYIVSYPLVPSPFFPIIMLCPIFVSNILFLTHIFPILLFPTLIFQPICSLPFCSLHFKDDSKEDDARLEWKQSGDAHAAFKLLSHYPSIDKQLLSGIVSMCGCDYVGALARVSG